MIKVVGGSKGEKVKVKHLGNKGPVVCNLWLLCEVINMATQKFVGFFSG